MPPVISLLFSWPLYDPHLNVLVSSLVDALVVAALDVGDLGHVCMAYQHNRVILQ